MLSHPGTCAHSSLRGTTPMRLSEPWLHILMTWEALKNTDSWVLPLWLSYVWLGFGLDLESFKSFQVRVSAAEAEHLCSDGSQVRWAPMGLVRSLTSEWGSSAICGWWCKSPSCWSPESDLSASRWTESNGPMQDTGENKQKKWGETRKFRERERL